MRILGIETSCDETAAAVVEDGKNILGQVVFSQIEIHAKFAGVVPEIASRNHLMKMLDVINGGLNGKGLENIDAVAVTNGPGLIGALLVGLSAAKAIAYSRNIPLIPVNHIEAHMYAPHLFSSIAFPYISLMVSGGHTLLFQVNGFDDMELLGSTIDDAAGEAFDKVAKLLGLGYPGGPLIDEAARNGDPDFLDLPAGLPDTPQDRYNFSYSGLKTAVAFRLKKMGLENKPELVPHIAASFQKAAVEMLFRKTGNALRDTGLKRLVVTGGVAANSYLRNRFEEFRHRGVEIYSTPLAYCSDNGAMVAGRGFIDFQLGRIGDFTTDAFSRLSYIVKGKRAVERS